MQALPGRAIIMIYTTPVWAMSTSDLDYASVSAIAKGNDDVLYILCGGYDENFTTSSTHRV